MLRFAKELPTGVYKIIFEAIRSGNGGVAMDDVRIGSCQPGEVYMNIM